MLFSNHSQKSLLLLLAITAPAFSYAAWNVAPTAQLQTSYEDNVRLSSIDKDDAIVTTATGQMQLKNSTEISNISAVAGISVLKYSATKQLNNQSIQFLNLNADRRTTNFNLRLAGSYRRDFVLRRAQELLDTETSLDQEDDPNQDIDDDFSIAPDLDNSSTLNEIRRENIRISPSLRWNYSERTSGSLGLTYSDRSYGNNAALVGLSGSTNKSVALGVRRRMNLKNTLSLRASASYFEPDVSANSEVYELRAIWDHRYSERSRIGVQVGIRRTERDLANSSNSTGFLFRLSGNRRYETFRLRATLERSVFPSSFGELVETDRFTLNLNRPVSARTSFSLALRAFQSDTNSDNGRSNDQITIDPSINYSVSPAWALQLSYRYNWIDRKLGNTTTDLGAATGNSISLAFSYRPPRPI